MREELYKTLRKAAIYGGIQPMRHQQEDQQTTGATMCLLSVLYKCQCLLHTVCYMYVK